MIAGDDFHIMLDKTAFAMKKLASGDPNAYKDLWSRGQDVSVLGGFGGYALGWDQVEENTDMAASRFRDARSFNTKLIAIGEIGDLAYAVWIEHGDVQMVGQEDYGPIVVRVTHIFRREDGTWKIIHRHGDLVSDKNEAAKILQR